MNFIRLFITVVVFNTVFAYFAIAANKSASKDEVVVVYNGIDVKGSEVLEYFKDLRAQQKDIKDKKFGELDKGLQDAFVRGYINMKLLTDEAEKVGIRKSQNFQKMLREAELQLLQQTLIEEYVTKHLSDKMIDEEFSNIVKELKNATERKASHILVDTEEKAKEIRKQLTKNENFSTLAQKFSKDESSKINNGELGYVRKGQLVPEFEQKLFSMKKGEISNPVKTDFGWHIIKMIDERPVQVPTKEQLLPSIRQKLSQDIITEYLKKLYDNAKVEIKI